MIQNLKNIFSNKKILVDQITRKYTDIIPYGVKICFVCFYLILSDFHWFSLILLGYVLSSFLGWLVAFGLGIMELQKQEDTKKN